MMSARVALPTSGLFIREICVACLRLSILMIAGSIRLNTVISGVCKMDVSRL